MVKQNEYVFWRTFGLGFLNYICVKLLVILAHHRRICKLEGGPVYAIEDFRPQVVHSKVFGYDDVFHKVFVDPIVRLISLAHVGKDTMWNGLGIAL